MKSPCLVKETLKKFQENQDKQTAFEQSAYMKNRFSFFGIKKPKRAEIQKPIFLTYKISDKNTLETYISNLWKLDQRECQYTALDLLLK